MGMDAFYAEFPRFVLLGDGRVVLSYPPTDYSSGPGIPDVRVRRLTDAGVKTVVETAVASGQFVADARWEGMGALGLVDAGTATFTLNTGGTPVTVSVYGLGPYPPPDLPADELAVHQALNQLIEQLTTIDSWLPAVAWSEPTWEPYRSNTIRLFARNADADVPDNDAPFDERPWPDQDAGAWIEYPPYEWGTFSCRIADSDEADVWYEALSQADGRTRFTQDGHRHEVSVRLVLPGESIECPAT